MRQSVVQLPCPLSQIFGVLAANGHQVRGSHEIKRLFGGLHEASASNLLKNSLTSSGFRSQ